MKVLDEISSRIMENHFDMNICSDGYECYESNHIYCMPKDEDVVLDD